MSADRIDVLDTLDSLDDYLADREDVVDGDYGHPAPNEGMNLLRELREARAAMAELISRANYLSRTGQGMIAFRAALARVQGGAA